MKIPYLYPEGFVDKHCGNKRTTKRRCTYVMGYNLDLQVRRYVYDASMG